jgi:hypothetical protein
VTDTSSSTGTTSGTTTTTSTATVTCVPGTQTTSTPSNGEDAG